VADTSALGDLAVDYAADITRPVWEKCGELAEAGLLVAPDIVWEEIRRSKLKGLKEWAHEHRKMFLPLDDGTLAAAEMIAKRYGEEFISKNRRKRQADLWVVAMAHARIIEEADKMLIRRVVAVVQHESPRRNAKQSRLKIPDVCADLGVRCIRLPQMLQEEEARASR
jgi:hypothetical protein